MLTERITSARGLFEQLRPYIRPEGDSARGALDVALQQAEDEAGAAPAPPAALDVQLGAIAADLRKLCDAAGV